MTTLETERLIIRPWRREDRPALARMARDAEMMRYVTRGQTWSDEAIDQMLERQRRHLTQHGVCFGATALKASGEVIGVVGMQQLDNGDFELGWWVWKDYWGRGFATEAASAYVEYARHVMGLSSLVAVIDPPNIASKVVAARLGLRCERIMNARRTISRRDNEPIALYRIRFQ